MLKPSQTRLEMHSNAEKLVAEYLSRGGVITTKKAGTPKDLQRMRRNGWLFGGVRTFVNAMHRYSETSGNDVFAGPIAKPKSGNRKIAYDFRD